MLLLDLNFQEMLFTAFNFNYSINKMPASAYNFDKMSPIVSIFINCCLSLPVLK